MGASAGINDVRSPPALVTLLDHCLSGDISVSESAWTADGSTLTVDLAKRPNYGGEHGGDEGREVRPLWWPCAVRGGRKGPEDPKAPPKFQPNIQRLDSKIGEQAETKKSFQGKSKFQW